MQGDEDDVVFAHLTSACWLSEDDGVECRWCTDLFSQANNHDPVGGGLESRMLRVRLAMLPFAVLTVTAAVLIGMLV